MANLNFFVEVLTRVYDSEDFNRKFLFDYSMRLRAIDYADAEALDAAIMKTDSGSNYTRESTIVIGIRVKDKVQYFPVADIYSIAVKLGSLCSELFDSEGNIKSSPKAKRVERL